ncbi:PQQ-dependent sugar dehydrogenase [Micromonospora endolithica]|uniref:PQQ-dependent sugar dehydrogenase n=1 Tax=Micromonospora endolithica TaxID=230091 RepID=A0A3A9ZMY9_9ACTN|nr:PQQ-dependent sugar dehydrogenase [Micromonospora endolithica]RKN49284.1 PQQ-dependent sugar dehydrogenase [Micromonospora endolithica]TWJ23465.1 glucose/arabinose dehydrogenase [Micromonospora endolithica]
MRRHVVFAVATTLAVALGAVHAQATEAPPPTPVRAAHQPPPAPAAPAAVRPFAPARSGGPMSWPEPGGYDFDRPQVVATGLAVPWGLDFLPDGSALVAQRDLGTVLRIRPGRPPRQVARIPGVVAGGEAGLLGLAVSPTFRRDRLVYVCFTTASDVRVIRFRLGRPSSTQVILSGLNRATAHDGGRIAFGPDGMLYVGTGDALMPGLAQDLNSRNGKILRIRPDGAVPPDNPFPGSAVYSWGHRNVQGLAWDHAGRLFASELGAGRWDEVNRIVPGGNYGWPVVEGFSTDPRFRNPVLVWTPAEASPSGAAFAAGTLYVAALRGQRLWTVPVDDAGQVGVPVAELVQTYGRLRTVELAPDGSLWVATSNTDGRVTPGPDDDRILRFPPGGRTPQPPVLPLR